MMLVLMIILAMVLLFSLPRCQGRESTKSWPTSGTSGQGGGCPPTPG